MFSRSAEAGCRMKELLKESETSIDEQVFACMGPALALLRLADGKNLNSHLIPSDKVATVQLIHFVLVNGLAFVGAICCLVLAFVYPITWAEPFSLIVMWVATGGIGISVGHHRLFTHRSFSTFKPIRIALGICGAMAGQGSLLYWVCIHRLHHQHSDEQLDLHSPRATNHTWRHRLGAFWHAHTGWIVRHDVPLPSRYARDLLEEKVAMWINRYYLVCLLLGLLLPVAIGALIYQTWQGALICMLWGGFLRIFIGNNLTWSINSICHSVGYRTYTTTDQSCNNALLALPTFGEAWHNNHHAFSSSARFGIKWWELPFDSGYHFIRVLELLGLAWDVKRNDSAA